MKIDDATLMAFHDGELEPERARRIRVALLSDHELRARLEGLEQLGDFVRHWAAGQYASSVRAARRATRVRARESSKQPPLAWVRQRPARAFGVGLGLLALTLLVPGALRNSAGPRPVLPVASALAGSPGAPQAGRLEPAVSVESVNFGAQAGAIFLVQSGKSETTVVWLPEDPPPDATGTL